MCRMPIHEAGCIKGEPSGISWVGMRMIPCLQGNKAINLGSVQVDCVSSIIPRDVGKVSLVHVEEISDIGGTRLHKCKMEWVCCIGGIENDVANMDESSSWVFSTGWSHGEEGCVES